MQKRIFGLLTIAALAFGACQGATNTPSPSAPASTPPSASAPASSAPSPSGGVDLTNTKYAPEAAANTGGTIVLGEWQFPDSLNIYYAQAETDLEAAIPSFSGLWDVTNDLKYVPDLTKDVPLVSNGGVVVNGTAMDVTVHLKDGMQWSDGSPITCDDLIATWKWNMDPANTGLAGGTVGWEDISSIDGAGTTTCVMHFSKIYEGYLGLVWPLLPAKYIQSVPVKDATTKLYPMGNISSGVFSGPYIPTEIKTDAQITYKPNPNWKTISGHDPYLSSLIGKYYGTADAMLAGYKAGEIDVAQDLNDADVPKTAGMPSNEVFIHDSLTYELLALNGASFNKKFGSDWQTIEKAIKETVDKQAIANGPLAGNVTPTINFVSPLSWFYKDEGTWPGANPTQAKSDLAAAGWVAGSDGTLAKGGTKLSITLCTTTRQVREDTLALVASELKNVGIAATVLAKPPSPDVFGGWNDVTADTQCNLQRGNFDVAEFAYVSPADPLGAYNVYTCAGIPDNPPHNGQNITRTCIPALDAAWNQVKGSVDFNVVKTAMATVQDIYVQNAFEIPLYNRKDVWLVNPKLHNFTGNPTTFAAEWNIGDWWLATS